MTDQSDLAEETSIKLNTLMKSDLFAIKYCLR